MLLGKKLVRIFVVLGYQVWEEIRLRSNLKSLLKSINKMTKKILLLRGPCGGNRPPTLRFLGPPGPPSGLPPGGLEYRVALGIDFWWILVGLGR